MFKIEQPGEVTNDLQKLITYECNIKTLAAKFGITAAFMSRCLSGKDPATDPMLEAIGWKRTIKFERIGAGKPNDR